LCGTGGKYLSISKELSGYNFIRVWGRILTAMREVEVVLINDYRASVFCFPMLILGFLLKKYNNKVYVVIHSDRPNKSSFIIYALVKLKVKLIVTTSVQYNRYISHNPTLARIVRRGEHNNSFRPKKIFFSFVYFGRISSEKKIVEMVSLLKNILKGRSWALTIIGTGDNNIVSELNTISADNVKFINRWLEHKELASICKESTFVISNTEYEGVSLQIIEGVGFGCIPLVRSKGILATLDLPLHCSLENIDYYLGNNVGVDEIQRIYAESSSGVDEYFNVTYIGDVVQGGSV
jgi:glycosyltransferase involved in cell wall biosynthesis